MNSLRHPSETDSRTNQLKRSLDSLGGDEISRPASQKIPRLHPIFTTSESDQEPNTTFRWSQPALGRNKSCLYGVHLDPPNHPRVAAFDLDGTLIKSSFPKKASTLARAEVQWEWWHKLVPQKLKQVHEDGYSIVIVSNQGIKPAQLAAWKRKIPLIAAALPDVPFRIFAATAKDVYRKPMPGIWFELVKIMQAAGVKPVKDESFLVGDAAGRVNDFAGTDRKWALNLGMKLRTPEEYFLDLPPVPYKLSGFNVSSVPKNVPLVTPNSTPFLPSMSSKKPEIVLFVGYPAMGKSTFFHRHFAAIGYIHINQDILGNRTRCIKAVEGSIRDGTCCVVDNTNRDIKTRKCYIDLAQRLSVPIRCFVFEGSIELAWHNNLYRAFCQPLTTQTPDLKRELVPYLAFTSFRDKFEKPSADEGFQEIRKVFWRFEGDELEQESWNMWLQIDGK